MRPGGAAEWAVCLVGNDTIDQLVESGMGNRPALFLPSSLGEEAPVPDADAIVVEARAWIGTPYLHQASLKGVGCDCLGLLRDTLADAARRHLVEAESRDIRPGDILLFRWRNGLPAKHCAIATAPDRMIHAHDGAAVCEVALAPWWRRHLAGVFRFPA